MNNKQHNQTEMTISEHLRELKRRLFTIIGLLIVLFVIAYINSDRILKFIVGIGKSCGYTFVYIQPQEVLIQQFRIAGVLAIIVSTPVIVYHVIAFVAPAFSSKKSVKNIIIFVIASFIMFILGALFAYKILLPFMYKFLFDIGKANNIKDQVSIKEYITLFITMMTSLGIVAEMPLISILLTKIGILTPNRMKSIRNYIYVLILIIAAIITPPDVVSQCMVAVPMIILYEISILVCRFIKEEKHG